jgi:hypothetical protein
MILLIYRRLIQSCVAVGAHGGRPGLTHPCPRRLLALEPGRAPYAAVLMDAERMSRAGQSPDEVRAYFKSAVKVALRMWEHGIGGYGIRHT